MPASQIVRVTRKGIELTQGLVKLLELRDHSVCWGLWLDDPSDHPQQLPPAREASSDKQAPHLLVSTIHPACWTTAFRVRVSLSSKGNQLLAFLGALYRSHANIQFLEQAPVSYHRTEFTAVCEFEKMRSDADELLKQTVRTVTSSPNANNATVKSQREQLKKKVGQLLLPALYSLASRLNELIQGDAMDLEGQGRDVNPYGICPEPEVSGFDWGEAVGKESAGPGDLSLTGFFEFLSALRRYSVHIRPLWGLCDGRIWALKEEPIKFYFDEPSHCLRPSEARKRDKNFIRAITNYLNDNWVDHGADRFKAPFWSIATPNAEEKSVRFRFLRRAVCQERVFSIEILYGNEPEASAPISCRGLFRSIIQSLEDVQYKSEVARNTLVEQFVNGEVGIIELTVRPMGDVRVESRLAERRRVQQAIMDGFREFGRKAHVMDIRVYELDTSWSRLLPSNLPHGHAQGS